MPQHIFYIKWTKFSLMSASFGKDLLETYRIVGISLRFIQQEI